MKKIRLCKDCPAAVFLEQHNVYECRLIPSAMYDNNFDLPWGRFPVMKKNSWCFNGQLLPELHELP